MKILYTSDFHSDSRACREFVIVLDNHDFASGVIGGDLTEAIFRKEMTGSFNDSDSSQKDTIRFASTDINSIIIRLKEEYHGI